MGHDLLEARVDENIELDLDDRQQPVHGHPDRTADDPGFGEGSVDDPVLSVLVLEACRDTEHAPGLGDVLAEHDHAVVYLHRLIQREVERLHHRPPAHWVFPSSPAPAEVGGPSGVTSGGRSTERNSSSPSRKVHGCPDA